MIFEKGLYSWLQKNFIPDLELCSVKTSRYDCYSTHYKLDIELKCRRTHYDELIIEKGKYDALMSRCKKHGTTPVYINSTPKGIWAFYIAKIDIKWENRLLPKETDFSDNTFINKKIGYLPVSMGIKLSDMV